MMTEDMIKGPQIRTMTSPDGQRQMTITSIPVERDLRKKNVAAYARVSTLTENQAESFETQVEFYTTYISKNNDWNYVGIYADNGISGLSVKKRPEFLRMIDDAMNGKIDIILVKSISRFARNCLEAQTYVHQLKEKNVEVIFEKEGVSSFNPQTDMIFNFMAAIAQEESRSISENVRWTYKKLAEQGIRHLGNNRVLGYDEIKGELVPNDDAWIICQIFEDFVAGFTLREIAKRVNEKGGKTLRKKGDFTPGGINHLLHNEIYVGDRLLQKKPPKDYLTKKHIEGEYESYYVENAHECCSYVNTYAPPVKPVKFGIFREKPLHTLVAATENRQIYDSGRSLFCTPQCY